MTDVKAREAGLSITLPLGSKVFGALAEAGASTCYHLIAPDGTERSFALTDDALAAMVAIRNKLRADCEPCATGPREQERAAFEADMEGEELDFTLYTLPGCENSYSSSRTQLAYFAWRQGRAHVSGVGASADWQSQTMAKADRYANVAAALARGDEGFTKAAVDGCRAKLAAHVSGVGGLDGR